MGPFPQHPGDRRDPAAVRRRQASRQRLAGPEQQRELAGSPDPLGAGPRQLQRRGVGLAQQRTGTQLDPRSVAPDGPRTGRPPALLDRGLRRGSPKAGPTPRPSPPTAARANPSAAPCCASGRTTAGPSRPAPRSPTTSSTATRPSRRTASPSRCRRPRSRSRNCAARAFGQATWRPSPKLTLEAGLRVEVSEISQSGDSDQNKSFVYPKPRLQLTWTPWTGHQFRFRAERQVGQLDFGDFVASADIDIGQVEGGNPDLEPDKTTLLEAVYERRFWGEGVFEVSVQHGEVEGRRRHHSPDRRLRRRRQHRRRLVRPVSGPAQPADGPAGRSQRPAPGADQLGAHRGDGPPDRRDPPLRGQPGLRLRRQLQSRPAGREILVRLRPRLQRRQGPSLPGARGPRLLRRALRHGVRPVEALVGHHHPAGPRQRHRPRPRLRPGHLRRPARRRAGGLPRGSPHEDEPVAVRAAAQELLSGRREFEDAGKGNSGTRKRDEGDLRYSRP
ncbi:MAG: TonB-dependent receptor [Brevundimonas sp.]|nr:TonB-dependent receptor [Brevundimonas sp.]